MKFHLIALTLGFILDFVFGDPMWLYHPVCAIGNLIAFLEKKIRKLFPKSEKGQFVGGCLEVILVCLISFGIPWGILWGVYHLSALAGLLLETFWCYQLLAAKSLKKESMRVYEALKHGTIVDARRAVSMIVGRDTSSLTEEGVIKATVETVAENTSDGVIAPLFYMAVGGAPLMFLYKGINTMDSMLGYKNEKYLYFGRCAAKLDDAANYLPARISGWLMTAASFFAGLSGKNAFRIFRRDRKKHASPNSAQTESVMAGALGVQLAGNACYFGKVYEKPFIGDSLRLVEAEDIRRANRLMYVTGMLGWGVFAGIMALILWI